MQDTIVAIATPSGIGGICIVRLSGKRAPEIAHHITRKNHFEPRYATLCCLYDEEGGLIDEAIVLYFAAPKSYTCEHLIEFQCHGGDLIGNQVVTMCLRLGARMAYAGEFTKRAVLNGRIDIAQANALAQMIATKDMQFQRALIHQLKGELGVFVESVREILLSALAHTEVMIDYSEEDIPQDIIDTIWHKLTILSERLRRIYDFSRTRSYTKEKICLIGKPNVGKSSLLNSILLYDRAIISPIAGTTRDRIEEDICIDGHFVRLVDTAGIRDNTDVIEEQGIQKTKEALLECSIVLAVFDGASAFDEEDQQVVELIYQARRERKMQNLELFIIINKADKPQLLNERDICLQAPIIHISALDKEQSAMTIHNMLKHHFQERTISNDVILSASYQLESIHATIKHIQGAKEKLESLELELFAYHIRDALESIGHITHPYRSEEVLDTMFGEFCLGK